MSDQQTTICPWCQTEIAWDEDLGPEEQCPHCLNELSDYRSVSLFEDDGDQSGVAEHVQAHEHTGPSLSDASSDDDLYAMSAYEVVSRQLLDRQEVLADCVTCGQEMIHIGQLAPSDIVKQPISTAEWKRPLLGGKIHLDAFLCPTCFRVETKLTDPARVEFVKQLSQHSEEES
jgi:predicted RNA-binding Zn-ribbon protein involved in translation (DUF1610 family)